MARKPRIDFPGAWHHVMHRGARRAPIFRSDDDVLRFLGVLEDTVHRFGIEVGTDLTRRENRLLLNMTTRQVHNVVNRRSKKDARLARWCEALEGERRGK